MVTTRGVLLTGLDGIGPETNIVVPRSIPVEFYLPFTSGVPSSLTLSLSEKAPGYVNSDVLGIATEAPPVTGAQKVRFLETQPKTFSGTITMPSKSGAYDVIIEADGDLTGTNRDLLTGLVVSDPLTVKNSEGKPVEHALVYVERRDDRTGKFGYFPAATYGSHNPAYTDSDGSVDMILPVGEYSVNVNAPGYDTYQKKFSMTANDRQPYPQIALTLARFAWSSYAAYYWAVGTDLISLANWNIDNLAGSYRYLDFSLVAGLAILTCLSLLANLHRVKVTAEGFIVFLDRKFIRRMGKNGTNRLIGFVERSGSGMPVHGAVVVLVDKKTRAIAGRDITSSLGEFRLRVDPAREYDISIVKSGFATCRETVGAGTLIDGHGPYALEPEHTGHPHPVLDFAGMLAGSVFHALSDTLLFGVGILNVLLWLRLGPKVLPLMLVTAANTLLWLEYEWHVWKNLKK